MERDGYRPSRLPSDIGSAQDDNPSSSSKAQPMSAKPPRSSLGKRSCDFCKLKKVKCVILLQDTSKCTSCEKFNGAACTFSIARKKRGPKPKKNLNPNFSVFEMNIDLTDAAASSGGGRDETDATASNRSGSSRSSPSFVTSADPTTLLYLDDLSFPTNGSFSAGSLSYFTHPPALPFSTFPLQMAAITPLDLDHLQLQPPLLHNTITAQDPGSIVSTSSDPNFNALNFLESCSSPSTSISISRALDLADGYIPPAPVVPIPVQPNLTYPYTIYRDAFKDGIDVDQRLQNWIQSPRKNVNESHHNA